jgi:hypothetical protein
MIKKIDCSYSLLKTKLSVTNEAPIKAEGALASFFNSALGFSPTLFLRLPRSSIFNLTYMGFNPTLVCCQKVCIRLSKISVGLKPNAELRKDAKVPSIPISKLSKKWLALIHY